MLKLKFEQSKYRHWSGGIHRGRLDKVMKIYISTICKKILSNFIFKSFEKFQKIFSFSKIEKSVFFDFVFWKSEISKSEISKSEKYFLKMENISKDKMKIFSENFQNF